MKKNIILEAIKKEVSRMRKIKHIHLLSVDEILDVFKGIENINSVKELDKILEFSEKIDFVNCSVSISKSGEIGVKSKSSDLFTNTKDILNTAEETGIVSFKEFANFLKYLQSKNADKWFKEIKEKYSNELLELLNNTKNREILTSKIKNILGKRKLSDKEISEFKFTTDNIDRIQIFGELATPNTMNLIKYQMDKITPGAFVVFGCVLLLKNKEAKKITDLDISTTIIGKKIMTDFIKIFNSNNWHIYYKNIINLIKSDKIGELLNSIKNLVNFVKKNKDYIDKKIEEFKKELAEARQNEDTNITLTDISKLYSSDKILSEYMKLIEIVRNSILENAPQQSFLGAPEIEGVVIRNKLSNSIVKIVNLENFTQRNIERWSDNKYLSELTDKLFKDLIEGVFKNPDILNLSSKLKEKINDWLLANRGKRFSSIEDIIEKVVIPDIEDDISQKLNKLYNLSVFQQQINKIFNEYIDELNEIYKKISSKDNLDNLDKSILFKINKTKIEIDELFKNLNSVKTIDNAIIYVLRFILYDYGSKKTKEIIESYV